MNFPRQIFGLSELCSLRPILNEISRFGFVSFFESSSCELALKQKSHFLHGKMLHVKQAFRPFSTGKRGSQTQDGEETEEDLSRRVFVGGVSQRLCRRDLLEFFSGFGEVLDLVLLSDQKTGRHKGFAFLTFAKKEVAARVCAQRFANIIIDSTRQVQLKASVRRRVSSQQLRAHSSKDNSALPQIASYNADAVQYVKSD